MRGERLALWWVDRYTRDLPEHVRDERRAEIASDVWEHRAAAMPDRLGLSIFSRCVRGVPADLSWRRAHRCGRRRMPSRGSVARGIGWALAAMAYAFIVLVHGWFATALVGFDFYGADWAPGDVAATSRIGGTLLLLIVSGTLLLPRAPASGACLVIAGMVATGVVFWWALPILGPIAIAVIAASVVLARRRRRTLRARASASG